MGISSSTNNKGHIKQNIKPPYDQTNNMKKIILLAALAVYAGIAFAQIPAATTTISLKNKKDKSVRLVVQGSAGLSVEGYDGDDLIVQPMLADKALAGAVAGLLNITSSLPAVAALKGMGPNPIVNDNDRNNSVELTFHADITQRLVAKVPRSTHLSISMQGTQGGATLSLKDLTGELALGGNASSVDISNVTGPLIVNLFDAYTSPMAITVTHIKWIDLKPDPKGPTPRIYLASNQQDIDLSLPADIKASLQIRHPNGELYSDFNLVSNVKTQGAAHAFDGDLNGGGPLIYLNTVNGNIFLRKQK